MGENTSGKPMTITLNFPDGSKPVVTLKAWNYQYKDASVRNAPKDHVQRDIHNPFGPDMPRSGWYTPKQGENSNAMFYFECTERTQFPEYVRLHDTLHKEVMAGGATQETISNHEAYHKAKDITTGLTVDQANVKHREAMARAQLASPVDPTTVKVEKLPESVKR